MRIRLSAAAALGLLALGPTALAQEAGRPGGPPSPDGPQSVIRAADEALTCVEIADEAAALSQTMGGEPERGVFGSIGGVARAGAAALIPGAGLLIAGADALTGPDRERREAEARALQHRWWYLNGLYAGRQCLRQADAAPVAASEPAEDPTVRPVVLSR